MKKEGDAKAKERQAAARELGSIKGERAKLKKTLAGASKAQVWMDRWMDEWITMKVLLDYD